MSGVILDVRTVLTDNWVLSTSVSSCIVLFGYCWTVCCRALFQKIAWVKRTQWIFTLFKVLSPQGQLCSSRGHPSSKNVKETLQRGLSLRKSKQYTPALKVANDKKGSRNHKIPFEHKIYILISHVLLDGTMTNESIRFITVYLFYDNNQLSKTIKNNLT